MANVMNFPRQMLPMSKKTLTWAKQCLLWGDSKTFFNYSLVRKSVVHKKINYDLLEGKVHMEDIQLILNPDSILANYIPEHLQHYPIMNSKINVLVGEELKRPFDFRVVVTNPTAISEIENNKKQAVFEKLLQLVLEESMSEDEYNENLDKLNDYFTYEWLDIREVRANQVLWHYIREYNMPLMFNEGFKDALAIGEEIYQCSIVGGEPVIEKINPLKIRIFKSGYSNKIEDADVIILEDYWQPGRVIDTFYDSLSKKDIEYIENLPDHVGQATVDGMNNIDERYGFVNQHMIGEEFTFDNDFFFDPAGVQGITYSLLPYDLAGNVRVMRMYWKSLRKILKIKYYDPQTGDTMFDFYPEYYKPDEANGEEIVGTFWINEAWEGTLIGGRSSDADDDSRLGIFVNMQPCPVLYNRLESPSRCHFGIVGSIYNMNDDKPFSMVDMMKPYNYLYDAIHYRLNDAIAANWGDILELDLAKIPKGWDVTKWMYYAKINHIGVIDSFNEGTFGAATGKIAGGLNNAGRGIMSSNIGNYIQQLMNLLEFVKTEMGEVAGITRQREGLIANRETVGGVERSTLQSSYITEWYFARHDDVKRRALECFLETAKFSMKGKNKKFQYITSDLALRVLEVDGDEFAECDYGLIIDGSNMVSDLNQKIEAFAQAALQTQSAELSAIMKLYTTASLAEKQRILERSEQKLQQMLQQQQQMQLQQLQQMAEQQMQMQQALMEQQYQMNQENNETKVLVAQIAAQVKADVATMNANVDNGDDVNEARSAQEKEKLMEQMREFDARLLLDRQRLAFDERKAKMDDATRRKQISARSRTSSK